MKLRYGGAFQEDREQLPGREGGKQPKLGMDGYAGGSPLNCPLMPAPDSPQPLAVPAGLSLCGRHVWSWLAGVLAWRSRLSIIDFPPCLFCPVCHSVFPLLLFSFNVFALSVSPPLPLSRQPVIFFCYYLPVFFKLFLTPVHFGPDPHIYLVLLPPPPPPHAIPL